MAKFEFIEWLLLWLLELGEPEFQWDEGNRTKSAMKHGVAIKEVEEVFRLGMALPLGVQKTPVTTEPRFAIAGPTESNRMLTVVFTVRNGRIRPISTRPIHKQEKVTYEKVLRQIAQRV